MRSAPAPATGFAVGLARHGERPALVTGNASLSYGELDARVAAARAALETHSTDGRRALVRLRPAATPDFVVAWLAALTGGHTTLLTHDDGLAAAYRASIEDDGHDWQPTGAVAPTLHPDLRLLLSTSGSTGSPKLVRLSATGLESNAAAIASYLGLTADDVALTTLPLDYCYGLSVLHSHLAVGASIVLDDRSVTEPGLWEGARAHRVTSFAGVPHTFDLLGAAGWPSLPTLRQVTQAGGRLAPERVRVLAERGAAEGWELVVMYGQTEATARMAYLPPHLATTHSAAVGVAIPGGSLRLEPVAGAESGVGELVYSGPNVMLGYADHPADLARGAEIGELHTGDLARIADGLVEIVGRRARFAKLLGQRIDLDRVQALLALGGHDVACAESDGGRELVIAFAGRSDPLLAEEIATAAVTATSLPAHTIRVVAVAALPRLPNGKLDHQTVARLGPAPGSATHLEGDPPLVDLYARILGRRDVTPADSFQSLGGDSLSYVELSLRLERHVARLPNDWPTRPIAELAATAGRQHRRWALIDTSIALRAAAITMIVGTHTDLWVLLGGAHVLLAVAGANFARFLLTDEGPRARLTRVARTAARVAVPAVIWIGAIALLTGDYPWRTVLLLNDLLGESGWSEPAWHYWFLEVIVLLLLGAGGLLAVPWVMAFERRHRFAVATVLTVTLLLPRLWVTGSDYDGDVIHTTVFVGWLFAGGWAAAVARNPIQRLAVSALLTVGLWGFTGDTRRDVTIVAGTLLLVWVPTLPWPRALVGLTGTLASASLYIYLTHWQVYPWFEQRWPLGGLLASVALGVIAWQVVNRVSPLPRRAGVHLLRMRRSPLPRPHYAPAQLHRQESV